MLTYSVGNGAYIGEIIGLQLTGWFVTKYGNKKVMGAATVMMIGFVSALVSGTVFPCRTYK